MRMQEKSIRNKNQEKISDEEIEGNDHDIEMVPSKGFSLLMLPALSNNVP